MDEPTELVVPVNSSQMTTVMLVRITDEGLGIITELRAALP